MKTRKILAAVLATVLAFSMLAGCGENGGIEVSLNKEVKDLEGYLASAEPLELTCHVHYNNGLNMWQNDGPIAKEAEKVTNIKLTNLASAGQSDSSQAFNTMLIEDVLPDIIHSDCESVNQAGADGAMIPLEDYIEEYAPNIWKFFQENPDVFGAARSPEDGHLYYIPNVYYEGASEAWVIRQDWLDKLGLEVPKTYEEFYNVLKAFREQDPNGNGVKDEIPFLERDKNPYNLLALFGVTPVQWQVNDGVVSSSRTTEEFKFAIKEIAKWYKEGLIDPEIYTRANAREELFANNIGGVAYDWFSSTLRFNETIKPANPDFQLSVMVPPADINGEVKGYYPLSKIQGWGWGISKHNKYVAETLKFFDFWYTEEGRKLMFYGIEGVHHTVNADGTLEFSDEAKAYPSGVSTYMSSLGGSLNIGTRRMESAELAGMTPEAREGFKLYNDNVEFVTNYIPTFTHTLEENRVFTTAGEAVNTYMNEMLQNWVLGNKDVDATWDEYINKLNELGIDKVVKALQAAYDRMYK